MHRAPNGVDFSMLRITLFLLFSSVSELVAPKNMFLNGLISNSFPGVHASNKSDLVSEAASVAIMLTITEF